MRYVKDYRRLLSSSSSSSSCMYVCTCVCVYVLSLSLSCRSSLLSLGYSSTLSFRTLPSLLLLSVRTFSLCAHSLSLSPISSLFVSVPSFVARSLSLSALLCRLSLSPGPRASTNRAKAASPSQKLSRYHHHHHFTLSLSLASSSPSQSSLYSLYSRGELFSCKTYPADIHNPAVHIPLSLSLL